MQNVYPLFEKSRILKTELFRSLRDYAFAHPALEYQGYADGILSGCEVLAGEKELVVSPGIVKHRGFIYQATEAMRTPYEPSEQWEMLKMKMCVKKYAEDYIGYGLELCLDAKSERGPDELEVCRFKLRKGARLRSDYKDFADMDTEYDTVNLLHATWGGPEEATLAPAITRRFAEAVLNEDGSRPEDVSFAYLCLNGQGVVSRKVLAHYIARRLAIDMTMMAENRNVYGYMVKILEDIRLNRNERARQGSRHHQIVVD